ncbi:hypothetical protein JW835_04330 [bacterium]|nr:hypothetical protein [bacterium]
MNKEQHHFLKYWFSGFIKGLEKINREAQNTILQSCGSACAQSYTLRAFQDAKAQSDDLSGFLEKLARKFPEARYRLIHPYTIEVCYDECGCDLVRNGWVDSPLLCKCSVMNLKENFEKTFDRPVHVGLKSSILDGARHCLFMVDFL